MLPALLAVIGLGALVLGCSDEFSAENEVTDAGTGGTGGTGTTSGTAGTGGAGGAAGDAGVGGDAGGGGIEPAPDRPGFNGDYYICNNGSSEYCSIRDIDISANEMYLMTGYPTNRQGLANIDDNDPMATISANFGTGDQYFIETETQGYGYNHPVQTAKLSYGHSLVPFEVFENQVVQQTDVPIMSAIALIDQNGLSKEWLLPKVQYAQVEPILVIDLAKIPAGVVKQVDGQDRLFLPTYNKATDSGLVLSYGIKQDGWFDDNDLKLPVFTSGQKPSTVVDLGGNEIAVLNTEGTNGASINFINAQAPDPAGAVTSTISFGSGVKAVPLFELALTDDKNYAVVAGGTGSSLTTLYIVDMVNKQIAGSIDLSQQAPVDEIKDIEVKDNKAYISTNDDDDIDNVLIVDFSTPSSPVLEKTIDVGHSLGEIAVFKSSEDAIFGYVVAKRGWWESEPAETDPDMRIIGFKPAEVDQTDGGT